MNEMTLTITTLTGQTKVIPNVTETHISDFNLSYKLKSDSRQRNMLVSQIADISIEKTLDEHAVELMTV